MGHFKFQQPAAVIQAGRTSPRSERDTVCAWLSDLGSVMPASGRRISGWSKPLLHSSPSAAC